MFGFPEIVIWNSVTSAGDSNLFAVYSKAKRLVYIAVGVNSRTNQVFFDMTSKADRISKLKGRENYDTWKISAKSYLVIKKVWSCIEKGLAGDASSAQKEADQMAWSEIILLIDETIYSYVAETNTAKEAWDALQTAFEDSGLCRKVSLLKQLVQLKSSDCKSIEDYVNQVVMTSLKVKKTGLNLDDEIVASLMLAGLPGEFNPLVMAYEGSSEKLTTVGVKTFLLQETRFESNEEQSEAFYSKASKRKPTGFRCHNCGEVGHFAKYCPRKTNGAKVEHNEESRSFLAAKRGTPL